jgi:hypothetical protein
LYIRPGMKLCWKIRRLRMTTINKPQYVS